MSMISAQIDELRNAAEFYDGFKAADLMRDAADTIWQLRDDLQRTNAENDKLREDLEFERSENGWAREFLNRMGQKCGTKDCPSLVAYVTKLEAENAKLRKLVKRMRGHIKENCSTCDGWYCSSFDEDNECCVYDTLARELGVEVD